MLEHNNNKNSHILYDMCAVSQTSTHLQWKKHYKVEIKLNRGGKLGPIVCNFESAQLLLSFNNLHIIEEQIQLGFNLFHVGRQQMEAKNPFKQNKKII